MGDIWPDDVTWAVVLDGLVGAAIGGLVAAFAALWVVRRTAQHEGEREHARVLRESVAGVLLAAGGVGGAVDVQAFRQAFWRLHGANMSLIVQLRLEHEAVVDFVVGRDGELSALAASMRVLTPQAAARVGELAGDLSGQLILWARAGMPSDLLPVQKPSVSHSGDSK